MTEKPTAPISIGCDSKPFKFGEDVSPILDAAVDLGATILDTARGYRHSEEAIGQWLRKTGKRDEVYIVSKGCLPLPFPRVNEKALRHDLEKSLETLGTSYIDLYLLHRDQRKADMRHIFSILEEYRKEGKIKAFGVSNWTMDRVDEVNAICKENGFGQIKDISNNVSLLPWVKDPFGGGDGCVSFAGDAHSLERAAKGNFTIYAYSPLGRGILTGRVNPDDKESIKKLDGHAKKASLSPENLAKLEDLLRLSSSLNISLPTLAIAYLTHLDAHIVPVIGIGKVERLKKNLEAARMDLGKETMEKISKIIYRK